MGRRRGGGEGAVGLVDQGKEQGRLMEVNIFSLYVGLPYEPACPSVVWSVCRSVGRSVCLSVPCLIRALVSTVIYFFELLKLHIIQRVLRSNGYH